MFKAQLMDIGMVFGMTPTMLVQGLESPFSYPTSQARNSLQNYHPLCRCAFPAAIVEVGPELKLDDAASIRAFADTYRKQERPLHVLVNNAGANYMSEGVTADGIPLLTQVIRRTQPSRTPHKACCSALPNDRSMLFF